MKFAYNTEANYLVDWVANGSKSLMINGEAAWMFRPSGRQLMESLQEIVVAGLAVSVGSLTLREGHDVCDYMNYAYKESLGQLNEATLLPNLGAVI